MGPTELVSKRIYSARLLPYSYLVVMEEDSQDMVLQAQKDPWSKGIIFSSSFANCHVSLSLISL